MVLEYGFGMFCSVYFGVVGYYIYIYDMYFRFGVFIEDKSTCTQYTKLVAFRKFEEDAPLWKRPFLCKNTAIKNTAIWDILCKFQECISEIIICGSFPPDFALEILGSAVHDRCP